MATDLEIAKTVQLQHIQHIAEKLNLNVEDLELYGKYKAK
ncbi:MAG: formate--tetrahydrofolate ligase, partial [Phaeodactylibacter sp.]|nr:formate--tetrahydrofolate ligase [Phaeodactylibacter sp.]